MRYTGADDSEPTTVQTSFDLLREENLVVRPSLLRAIEHVINKPIYSLLSLPMYDIESQTTSTFLSLFQLDIPRGAGCQDQLNCWHGT